MVLTFDAEVESLTQDVIIHQDQEQESDEDFLGHIVPYSDQTYVDPNNDQCNWTIEDDDCKCIG